MNFSILKFLNLRKSEDYDRLSVKHCNSPQAISLMIGWLTQGRTGGVMKGSPLFLKFYLSVGKYYF